MPRSRIDASEQGAGGEVLGRLGRNRSNREEHALKWLIGFLTLAIWPISAVGQTTSVSPGPASAGPSAKAAAILTGHCLSCHGPDQRKGGLDLSRRAAALEGGKRGVVLVPGSPNDSPLVDKIEGGEMPPEGALAPDQIETMRAWVLAGAHYPSEPLTLPAPGLIGGRCSRFRGWPCRLPAGPAQPGSRTRSTRSSLRNCAAGGLAPAPEARAAALIRRVSFDLTGLPPTPEAVDQFVADPDPGAYDALVARLLASPHHGERWGRHWLDVVRFGESEGYETNLPRPNAWPYRDYVIRAFNRDTPFPRFVLEQLAGDTRDGATGSRRRRLLSWSAERTTSSATGPRGDAPAASRRPGRYDHRDRDDVSRPHAPMRAVPRP